MSQPLAFSPVPMPRGEARAPVVRPPVLVATSLPRKTAFVRRQARPRGLFILGLTGVMGSGKSALGRELARSGAVLWDADAEVAALRRHRQALLGHLRASPLALDEALLGEVGQEDTTRRREALRQVALLPSGLEVLEGYFLPRLRAGLHRFLGSVRGRGQKLVVLDVPLLFEKGYLELTDFTLNTNASGFLLRRRLAKRRGVATASQETTGETTDKTTNNITDNATDNTTEQGADAVPPSAALQLRLATAQWDLSARRRALSHSAGALIETGLSRAHTRRTSFAKLPVRARRLLKS